MLYEARQQEAAQDPDGPEAGGILAGVPAYLCAHCGRTFVDCPCLAGPMVRVPCSDGREYLVPYRGGQIAPR